jgi:uncharacterized RDD family membrane protein YckC
VSQIDELRIDTPEQVALELPIAGIGSRFLAIVVDTLLQGVTYFIATVLLILAASLAPGALRLPPVLAGFLPAILVFIVFCIYWGYFAFFEIVLRGQTPGKRVAGIRVIKDTGRPVDALSAILRNLLRGIDFLPALYAVGRSSSTTRRRRVSTRTGHSARRMRRPRRPARTSAGSRTPSWC